MPLAAVAARSPGPTKQSAICTTRLNAVRPRLSAERHSPVVESRTGQMTFWGFKRKTGKSTLSLTSHARSDAEDKTGLLRHGFTWKGASMKLSLRLVAAGLLMALVASSTPVQAQPASFTITAGVDNPEHGIIAPSGVVEVAASNNQTFVVTANPGYKVAYLMVDGKNQGAKDTFTFSSVAANHTIKAGFSLMTYTIDATSGPNGTISPQSLQQFESGDNQTYTITPNAGYEISDVRVDGSPQGQTSSYTFTNIQRDHTIIVFFSALNQASAPLGSGPSGPSTSAAAPPNSPAPSVDRTLLLVIIAAVVAALALSAALVIQILQRRRGSKPGLPAFTVKDLEISPKELRAGSRATVAVTVANHGPHAGTFKITLKIDGITKGAKEVTVARGTSDRVEFTVPATEPGSFAVNVGDLAGTLTVVDAQS